MGGGKTLKEMLQATVPPPTQQPHSPSPTKSPPLGAPPSPAFGKRPWTPNACSPAGVRTAVASVRGCLEDVGHLTRLQDPLDQWLPITESRNGNACYSAFHTLCAGVGFQALVLPVAFASLSWTWGILCLSMIFSWQLYTLWILTQLHEAVPGTRFSRYLHLCSFTFGEKLGKLLAKFPIMYLSGGTCTALIVTGGGSLKLFFETVCGPTCSPAPPPLTAVEWYLVFVCLAAVVSQLPNLNSIAGVSLVGAITAVAYCTASWALPVAKGRTPEGRTSYVDPVTAESEVGRALKVLNAVGIVAFAFRGHNLALEIQATMPSTAKCPSRVPMWKGVKAAYALIAACLFPVAVGGYWAYGDAVPHGGIQAALHKFHSHDTPRIFTALMTLLVVVNCLCSFQIYAMPVFDALEAGYAGGRNTPCPRAVRAGFRLFFGALTFLISVTFPFLPDLAGLLGGVALPVTLAYPCFMWVLIKKPRKYSSSWWVNWGLGAVGMMMSIVLTASGLWSLVDVRLKLRFFRARGGGSR